MVFVITLLVAMVTWLCGYLVTIQMVYKFVHSSAHIHQFQETHYDIISITCDFVFAMTTIIIAYT